MEFEVVVRINKKIKKNVGRKNNSQAQVGEERRKYVVAPLYSKPPEYKVVAYRYVPVYAKYRDF